MPREQIDFKTQAIKDGRFFIADGQTILGSGSLLELAVITPAAPVVLADVKIDASGAIVYGLQEDATYDPGTTVAAVNANRGSALTANTLYVENVSASAFGTTISEQSIGKVSIHNAMELDDSSTYLIRVDSQAASNRVSWKIAWVEG